MRGAFGEEPLVGGRGDGALGVRAEASRGVPVHVARDGDVDVRLDDGRKFRGLEARDGAWVDRDAALRGHEDVHGEHLPV